MASPQQELYDGLFIFSQNLGYTTYDHLPMQSENAKYPFVVIGESQMIPGTYKTARSGRFTQTIHVWGGEEMRLVVSDMVDEFVWIGNRLATQYDFVSRVSLGDVQLMQDTSVPNTVLNHGIVTLVFDLT